MLRVRCQATATLDDKGRVALPAPIKKALADAGVSQLVLICQDDAIKAYIPADFEAAIEAPLRNVDPRSPEYRAFVDAYVRWAQDAEIDGQGRVRIPPDLRADANLGRELIVSVVLGHVEISDKSRVEERRKSALVEASALPYTPGWRPAEPR